MPASFYFYDLETSGFNPREARIMQFAGQRTDMSLKPIGEPHDILIRMTDEIVPDPDAVLITGITPQKTIDEGVSEAEFLRLFHDEVATQGTIFVGYNTVRFDDEFMRYLHYRNFYDAYEWQYKDERSKWDLLDVVRMTRALRPDGIKWPVDDTGKPVNKLEALSTANDILHDSAHDALSDVRACIGLAQLIRDKQPKLFEFLLNMRGKDAVARLVTAGQPFVYTSGKYDNEFEKTTVAAILADHPGPQGSALVFDLRYGPSPFIGLDPPALAEAWRKRNDIPGPRLPVKTLKYNRCPAVAPLSVLDEASQERLKLDMKTVNQNFNKLQKHRAELQEGIIAALDLLDQKQKERLLGEELEADARLYDGFVESKRDKTSMSLVRAADGDELGGLEVTFQDDRLQALLPLYKARNFPSSMSEEDRETWERFRSRRLVAGGNDSRLGKYFARLAELAAQDDLNSHQRYLVDELSYTVRASCRPKPTDDYRFLLKSLFLIFCQRLRLPKNKNRLTITKESAAVRKMPVK
jgi:exodeoxyribonuclease I